MKNAEAFLKRVSDIPDWDPSCTGAIKSGLAPLDKTLGGGFRPGEVTIWSGTNSSGKSTLLGQVMLEAIDQDQAVCAYSGELPERVFRYWLELQAAGPDLLEAVSGEQGGKIYRPCPPTIVQMREWYQDRLYLYDGEGADTSDDLLNAFRAAAAEYSCRVFLLDNLTMVVSRLNASDQYRTQRELILEMIRFARETPAHVHIVVHPRKTPGTVKLSKNDISGSGDITNLADNVLVLARSGGRVKSDFKGDARLTVLKNRFGGRQDIDIDLNFDLASRRFYPIGSGAEDKEYGWKLRDKTKSGKGGRTDGRRWGKGEKPAGQSK